MITPPRRKLARTWVQLDGTATSLTRAYRLFNRCYFGNRLETVRIRFGAKGMHALGEYNQEAEEIVLNPQLKHWRRVSCLVLLHEMCHVAHPLAQHGSAFQREMLRLARIGALKDLW